MGPMQAYEPDPTSETPALQLGGMVSTFTVVKIERADPAAVGVALQEMLARTPDLFEDAPVALDLSGIDGPTDRSVGEGDGLRVAARPSGVSLGDLVRALRAGGLLPVAVCDPSNRRRAEARALGLASLRGGGRRAHRGSETGEPATEDLSPVSAAGKALTLRHPVRGGQVVYAEGTDAVVLGPVNPGGEVIADGHIHIYGPLRGRALAGAHGDLEARVFCQRLEAELVSIAGVYLQAEQLPAPYRGQPAQVFLDGETLVVGDL